MSELTVHYLSDLHLEFYDENELKDVISRIIPKSEICVLAGDICYPFQKSYEIFLMDMNNKFKHVFLIHGNHEYYRLCENEGKLMKDIINKTNDIINSNDLKNIHFLNNSYYDIGNYRFAGTVLWSHIKDPNYLINDADTIVELDVNSMNRVHNECTKFIENITEKSKQDEKKLIVVTHHMPSYTLIDPKYEKYKKYNQCFASDCDYLVKDPIICWIFGHTHTKMEKTINNIPVLVNPIGYPEENECVDYNVTITL